MKNPRDARSDGDAPNPSAAALEEALAQKDALLHEVDHRVGLADHSPRFGLTIVQLLCQQLHAGLETAGAQPGVRTTVTVPMTSSDAP